MSVSLFALTRTRGLLLLAAALPIAISQLARVVDQLGPSTAAATTSNSTSQPVATQVEQATTCTPAQARAMDWIAAHRADEIRANPFAKTRVEVAPVVEPATPEPAPPVATRDPEPTAPDLKISGFFGKGDSAMVSINRRVRRVGEEVAPGWVLKAIDADIRVVRLQHSSGSTIEVSANPK